MNIAPKSFGFRPSSNNLRRVGIVTGGIESRDDKKILTMIARYNRISLWFGVPGLLLQFVVPIAASMVSPAVPRFQQVCPIVGTILVIIGVGLLCPGEETQPVVGLAWILIVDRLCGVGAA